MNNRMYVTPDWPAPKRIRAYTTTRNGGFSQAPFDSFNLAAYVNDDIEHVDANQSALIKDLDLPKAPIWLHQVHGNCAVRIDECNTSPDADASITQKENTICAVLTADCLPVLLCNRDGTEVAAVHAGWKGLLVNVIDATIAAMHASPDDIIAWMGPALGPDHFELSHNVYADFLNANPDYGTAFDPHNKRWHLDCYAIAKIQLMNAGVTNIYGGDFCTFKERDRFYSYRRDKGITGRMASLIYIT